MFKKRFKLPKLRILLQKNTKTKNEYMPRLPSEQTVLQQVYARINTEEYRSRTIVCLKKENGRQTKEQRKKENTRKWRRRLRKNSTAKQNRNKTKQNKNKQKTNKQKNKKQKKKGRKALTGLD